MNATHAVVLVSCPCCAGRGSVRLTGEYLRTLLRLRELGGEHTGAELGRDMGVRGTAMNNRLAALERFGLVSSRWWGRERLYVAKAPAPEPTRRAPARKRTGNGPERKPQ